MAEWRELRSNGLAAVGALVLGLSMWLPWYSFRIPSAAIDSAEALARQLGAFGSVLQQGAQIASQLGPLHVSAWQVYTALPIVLLVCAVVGGSVALLAWLGRASGASQLIVGAGVVGILLVVFRLVEPPLNGLLLHPTWGLFVALGGSLAMVVGGRAAGSDERRSFPAPDLSPLPATSSWSTIHSVPPPTSG